jgi:hypothetical protein
MPNDQQNTGLLEPEQDGPDGQGPTDQDGGEIEGFSFKGGRRKRRKSRKKSKKKSKNKSARKTKKKKRRKKKLNKYFALMLAAKKKGLKSFKYKGKTYVGRKHNRLGMIYKKK